MAILTPRAYLRALALALAGMAAAVATFCALVDPYGIVGTPPLPGLTADKFAASPFARLAKPYRVEQLHPKTIIFGSSAANIGFDPQSPAWPEAYRPVYNFGIDGAAIAVQRRFLQHALARATPHLVVFATSFEDMMLARRLITVGGPGDPNDFEYRLRIRPDGTPNPLYPLARARDLFYATLSLEAFRQSISTITDQNDPDRNAQTPNGLEVLRRFPVWIRRDGIETVIAASFRQRFSELIRNETIVTNEIVELATMVRIARQAGADVAIVIIPTFRPGLEVRRRMSLTKPALSWLTTLVKDLHVVAEQTGGPSHVAIWDFEGYDTPVQQPMPSPDDKHLLNFFWESVHFRTSLGDIIAAQITAPSGTPGFGVRLTPANVDQYARDYEQAEAAWVSNHPKEATRILNLMEPAHEAVCRQFPKQCTPPKALLP